VALGVGAWLLQRRDAWPPGDPDFFHTSSAVPGHKLRQSAQVVHDMFVERCILSI
jgi:hypothetical protein